jgi:predicted ATPase/class 3 adenylate cyclase
MRADLPAGIVTLVFTDIEGSTKLLHELGAERYVEALAEHRRLLREAFGRHGGIEIDTQGDAFFYAFPQAHEAVAAAEDGREALRTGPIHVRVGIHTGAPHLGPEGYVGEDVHLGARIGAAGHGGQVLLSEDTRRAAGLALDDAALVLDLGEHRLKDFEQPVRILQLGSERFPPLKTISNTNLPRPASSFVGREREVEDVTRLVREDGARLVTLTGPGGSGKTRLSIEAAAELVGDHKAGTFWVELAPLRDPSLVLAEIGKTIGASDGLAGHVGEREMLLVLDNLEQVIDAAPELASLVEPCPNLRLLVTSRERLRVRGEVEYPVSPLAESDAVELFLARAGYEHADDDVRALCRALDDMPLAIELAAARASVLTPVQILERLSQRLDLLKGGRDADPRQRTLRSTIEWSHDLLDPDEQRLFGRLAVFVGGCTFETAEQVADADLDTLQSLVDKSLVRRTDDRFWMYETIREFALERLEASGEADQLRRLHAEHFLALAEEAAPLLRHESEEWLDRLEREHDNVRAALDRFETTADHERAMRLGAAVWRLWSLRGYISEGHQRIERLLSFDVGPTPTRANLLLGAADLATDIGDHAIARARSQEALELHRVSGDRWGEAEALLLLGVSFTTEGEWPKAPPYLEESAGLFHELGDEHNALEATRILAWSQESLGDLDRARAIHEENVRRARAVGDAFVEARTLATLGQYRLGAGDVDGAIPFFVESHRLHRGRPNLPDRYSDAVIACRFARALALRGRPREALMLLGCWEAASAEMGVRGEEWLEEINEETTRIVGQSLDEPTGDDARNEGRKLTVDQAVTLALEALRSS